MAYKFRTTIKDMTATVKAEPVMEEITTLYKKIAAGIEEELINNMPPEALIKLMYALMSRYVRDDMSGNKDSQVRVMDAICALVSENGDLE